MLGGTDVFCLTQGVEVKSNISDEKVRAGIIFTHLASDYHSDHRTTANIVETAAMVSSLDTVPVKKVSRDNTLLYHTSPLTLSDPLDHR